MFDSNLGGASAGALLALPQAPFQRPLTPIEFRPFTALKELPPEPLWLWRGYLAPGSLTMLAGHPFAGKSMLVGGLLRALHYGGEFLGRPTRASTALVISEEDEGTLRQRSEILGLLELDHDYLARSTGSLSLDWPSMIKQATTYASGRGHRLLVVDTFPGLADLRRRGERRRSDRRPATAAAASNRTGSRGAVSPPHERLQPTSRLQGLPRNRRRLDAAATQRRASHTLRLERESRFPASNASQAGAHSSSRRRTWRYEALEGSGQSGNGPLAASIDHAALAGD